MFNIVIYSFIGFLFLSVPVLADEQTTPPTNNESAKIETQKLTAHINLAHQALHEPEDKAREEATEQIIRAIIISPNFGGQVIAEWANVLKQPTKAENKIIQDRAIALLLRTHSALTAHYEKLKNKSSIKTPAKDTPGTSCRQTNNNEAILSLTEDIDKITKTYQTPTEEKASLGELFKSMGDALRSLGELRNAAREAKKNPMPRYDRER